MKGVDIDAKGRKKRWEAERKSSKGLGREAAKRLQPGECQGKGLQTLRMTLTPLHHSVPQAQSRIPIIPETLPGTFQAGSIPISSLGHKAVRGAAAEETVREAAQALEEEPRGSQGAEAGTVSTYRQTTC